MGCTIVLQSGLNYVPSFAAGGAVFPKLSLHGFSIGMA